MFLESLALGFGGLVCFILLLLHIFNILILPLWIIALISIGAGLLLQSFFILRR